MRKILKYDIARIKLISLIAREGLEPGSQLPSEKILVEKFGMSLISLRHALDVLAKDGVIEKIQGRGSFLRKSIQAIDTQGTVVLIDIQRPTQRPAVSTIAEVQAGADQLNLELKYMAASQPGSHIFNATEGAMGLLVTGRLDQQWADFIKLLHIPTLVLGSNPFPDQFHTLTYDWRTASRMLVEHFFASGIKRVGLINGERDYFPAKMMAAGYQDALASHGQAFDANNILWPKRGAIHRQLAEFLKSGRFDAVVVESGYVNAMLNWYWNHRPAESPVMGIADAIPEHPIVADGTNRVVKAVFSESVFANAVDALLATMALRGRPKMKAYKAHLVLD